MSTFVTMTNAATHQLYAGLLAAAGRRDRSDDPDSDRDRGAVSLEQVLWFAAAGIAVAVIAGIIFQRITDEADSRPITTAPAPADPTP